MKKIYLILLLMPFFSFTQKIDGNKYIDSLLVELSKTKVDTLKVDLLNKISSRYGGIDPTMSENYSIKAIALSKKINWQYGIAESYIVLSKAYIQTMDFKSAILYSNLALKYNKNNAIVLKVYNNLSKCYLKKSDLTKALYYSNMALKISEDMNEFKDRPITYNYLGHIYFNLKQYDKSIEFLNKSLLILNYKFKMSIIIPDDYLMLGNCYTQKKNFNLASKYFDKCMNSSSQNGYNYNSVIQLSDIITTFNDNNEFVKALFYQNKLDSVLKKTNFSSSFCDQLSGNPNMYLENARIEKNKIKRNKLLDICINRAKKRIEISNKIETKGVEYDDYYILSQAQKLKGNYKEALESHEKYAIYKDSIFNSDNKETIKNLEDKREIMLRDKQIQIDIISLKAKEKQKWFLLSAMALLAVIGCLLFYQNKNREKTNQKLQNLNTNLDQANKTKIQLLSILNHDLRSPVNSFIHYIQFQKENPDLLDQETKSRIENQTLTSAKNLLHSMEDILLWTKDQMENFNPVFKNTEIMSVFDDTKNHFSAEKNVNFIFDNPEDIILHTDENFLKTIIRNLTGNAVKAVEITQNPLIIWKAWRNNGHKYLSIQDNGSGASKEEFKALFDEKEMVEIQSGLGLHLIRDLSKAILCEISVDSKENIGTTFTLKFVL